MSVKRFAVLLFLLAWASTAAHGEEYLGSAFDLGGSARALGLGGAFTALVDDETAVVYNPAALGRLASVAVSSLYARQFAGITYAAVTVSMPWVGIHAALLDSGLIASPQGNFRYASQSVAVGGGIPIGPFAVGARWRVIHVSSPVAGSGWSLDPSVLLTLESLRIGALLESAVSSPLAYESDAQEAWEPSLRVGVAATLSPAPDVWWNASLEASRLMTSRARFSAGLEAWMSGLGARVGYDGQGVTVGLSVRLSGLQLDWAYAMRSDLGSSHRVSLSVRF